MYTWNIKWIKKYESPWSIVNKFILANSLYGSHSVSIITNNRHRSIETCKRLSIHTGIISNYGLNDTFWGLNDISINEYSANNVSTLLKPFLEYRKHFTCLSEICRPLFNETLYYCPICIKRGEHMLYHQFTFLDKCLIHNTSLTNKCPNCGNELYYEINFNNSTTPFQCKYCGKSIYQNEFDTLIDFWINSDPQYNIYIKPFSKYKHIIPLIIADFYFNITDNLINKTIREMFTNVAVTTISKVTIIKGIRWHDIEFNSIIKNHIRVYNDISDYAYIYALRILYRHIRKSLHLSKRKLYNIEIYKGLWTKHKIVEDDTINNIIDSTFDINTLVYYLWRRDLEYNDNNFDLYYLNACNFHPYHFYPDRKIMSILSDAASKFPDFIQIDCQFNILVHLGVSMMYKLYIEWDVLVKELVEKNKNNKIRLLNRFHRITLKNKDTVEKNNVYLLLINKYKSENRLYYE